MLVSCIERDKKFSIFTTKEQLDLEFLFTIPFEFVERKTTQLRVCALVKNLVASSLTPRVMQFSAVVVVPLAQATHFSGY